MEIRIIKGSITKVEITKIAQEGFGDFVKAVIDVEQEIMAVGGEFHAEEEVMLMEQANSKREHTWGVNLYPAKPENEFVEFDSMINLKPALGNRSRGVEDPHVRAKILTIIKKLVV